MPMLQRFQDLTQPNPLDPASAKQFLMNLALVPNNKMFGAKCDARPMNDAATFAGNPNVYCSSFGSETTANAAGKKVYIPGGNLDGSVYVGTIASVSASAGGYATLSAPVPATTAHTYSYYGTDDTVANQACIDYVASLGGGFASFAPGMSISNGLLIRNGVTLQGQGARSFSPVLVGTGLSRWVASSDTTSGAWNGGIRGVDLTGIGNGFGTATGSGPVQGGFEIGGLGIYEHIIAKNFGEQCVGCRTDAIAYRLESVFATFANRNYQTSGSADVERGAVELAGTDGVLFYVECYGSQLALVSTSIRNCGILLKSGAGNHDLFVCRAEEADAGIIDRSSLTRFTSCRTMRNWGHGFVGMQGRHVNGEALGNSRAGSGTYNGFDTGGLGGGFLTNCRSEKAFYVEAHKYGFGGATPSGGRTTMINCTSEGHAFMGVNPTCFIQRDALVQSSDMGWTFDFANGKYTCGSAVGNFFTIPGLVYGNGGPNTATIPFTPQGDFVVYQEVVVPASGFKDPIAITDGVGNGFFAEFGPYGTAGAYSIGTSLTVDGTGAGGLNPAGLTSGSTVKLAFAIANGKGFISINGTITAALDAAKGVNFQNIMIGMKANNGNPMGVFPPLVRLSHGTFTATQIQALTT